MKQAIEYNAVCLMDKCTGCGACVNICPKKAITMKKNKEGFLYPNINKDICVACGLCEKKCPVNRMQTKYKANFYMGWHNDKEVLKKSSSGGAFTALANYVLERNGCVVGATKDENDWKVYHTIIDSKEQLDLLRFSKYSQSNTKDIYLRVKDLLEKKVLVLFSGTACQIAALYSVLGTQENSGLITVDILCHGCASEDVVSKYIAEKEKQYRRKLERFEFRNKDVPWITAGGFKLQFDDGYVVIEKQETDPFFISFNRNMILRESCYTCNYCGTERITDFTIADFWGVPKEKTTEEQRKRGISIVLVNTERAGEMLNELKKEMYIEKIDPAFAISHNQSLKEPNLRPENRNAYFESIEKNGLKRTVKKFFGKYLIKYYITSNIYKVLGEKNYKKIRSLFP